MKKEFGQKGYQWAEKMIALKPEGVAGHYLYTINLGNYGEGISILKALGIGLDKLYRQHGDKAVALDPNFEAVGRYYDVFAQTTDEEVLEVLGVKRET